MTEVKVRNRVRVGVHKFHGRFYECNNLWIRMTWKKGEHIISVHLYLLVIWSNECGFPTPRSHDDDYRYDAQNSRLQQREGREKEGEGNFFLADENEAVTRRK